MEESAEAERALGRSAREDKRDGGTRRIKLRLEAAKIARNKLHNDENRSRRNYMQRKAAREFALLLQAFVGVKQVVRSASDNERRHKQQYE